MSLLTDKSINSRNKCFIPLIAALPAVLIGAIAMNRHNIPSMYYLLNIVSLLVGWGISCYVIGKKPFARKNKIDGAIILGLIILLLALTFMDVGLGEVHRWLSVGPIRLYLSSMILPLLIIASWMQLQNNRYQLVGSITLITGVLLVLQPDASQLTAFAIPMMIILYKKFNNRILLGAIFITLGFMILTSWIFLDHLPPVKHVEQILELVMDMGLMWAVLGILSLVILPLPFFLLPMGDDTIVSKCLGIYFAISIMTPFWGSFPVPLMGYGISPIIGYLVAITWLVKTAKFS